MRISRENGSEAREEVNGPTITFNVAGASLLDAIAAIDRGAASMAVAVDGEGRFAGVVSDGDIRRALLAGIPLEGPVDQILVRNPVVAAQSESRSAVLDLMRSRGIDQVPVLDEDRKVVGIHLLRQFIGHQSLPNLALLMAGGRGRRLGAITDKVPKPMVRVAGRPILERLVNHLVGFGISKIGISLGYMGHVIADHFSDGAQFGCEIRYFQESEEMALGTAGALPHLVELYPQNESPVIIVNGDLVTQFDVADFLRFHERSGSAATVGAFPYALEIPYGVLELDRADQICSIEEKPTRREWVSGGIYAVNPNELNTLPRQEPLAMTDLLTKLIEAGKKVGMWPIEQDWIDVGRPADLAEARGQTC